MKYNIFLGGTNEIQYIFRRDHIQYIFRRDHIQYILGGTKEMQYNFRRQHKHIYNIYLGVTTWSKTGHPIEILL